MGLIRSARNLFQNVLQLGWGGLSERLGKRIFILTGYFFSSITVVALVILQISTPTSNSGNFTRNYLVTRLSCMELSIRRLHKNKYAGKSLGKILSVSRFSGVGATLLVALIAVWIPSELTASSFIIPFLLSAAAGIIGGILVIFVKEKKVKNASWRIMDVLSPMLDKKFRIFLIVNSIFLFTMAFAWPLFPYVTVEIIHATLWQIALISSMSGIVVSFTQPKFGSIADKIGRKPLIAASSASFFLFPLLYALATHWLHLVAIHALLAFSMSESNVSTTAYILDSAPIGKRGIYTGAYNLFFGLTTFLGSLAGGIFGDYLSAANGVEQVIFTGLVASAILRLITSTGFLAIKETSPKKKS